MSTLDNYTSRGARAMVLMHEGELTAFVATWKRAKAAGVVLPQTQDPSYASMEALLRHILNCARHYMVWLCECLELPDPEIREAPDAETIEAEADAYTAHVLERWRLPLADVGDDRIDGKATFTSGWGVNYCIDAMLEHAVMHPKRHAFQLEGMME